MTISPLQKSLRPVPRTWEEATHNATYASPIQKFPSNTHHALSFLPEIILGFVLGVVSVSILLLVKEFL